MVAASIAIDWPEPAVPRLSQVGPRGAGGAISATGAAGGRSESAMPQEVEGGGERGPDALVGHRSGDMVEVARGEPAGLEIAASDGAGRTGQQAELERVERGAEPLADAARLGEVEAVADQLRRDDAAALADIIGEIAGAAGGERKQKQKRTHDALTINRPARTPCPIA